MTLGGPQQQQAAAPQASSDAPAGSGQPGLSAEHPDPCCRPEVPCGLRPVWRTSRIHRQEAAARPVAQQSGGLGLWSELHQAKPGAEAAIHRVNQLTTGFNGEAEVNRARPVAGRPTSKALLNPQASRPLDAARRAGKRIQAPLAAMRFDVRKRFHLPFERFAPFTVRRSPSLQGQRQKLLLRRTQDLGLAFFIEPS